ncbi:uncharacterized protein zbbx isoform X1 [Sebastes fasciatus]|uniref:uncharacterized protein zbbx isoform X1 n=2 Tax=Sebastes fasciatus TaxID=394691 RepID=UPI003D9FB069
MIPIQTDLQTHVSTRDVVSCLQKQINPSSSPSTSTSPAVAKPTQLYPDSSQVLTADHGEEEEKMEMIEERQRREDERGFPTSLLRGEYNEEESATSFQEALRQWRGEKSDDESREPRNEEAMWTPIRPASVSAMATQADLAPDRGRGGREGRVPVRVEFAENSLTYMDRLLLKKHRRAPIEIGTNLKSLPNANTADETASSLTAQEEDFRRYCASLFAVPVSRGRTEPQITTPESCLVIEVLDERDGDTNGVFVAEQRTDNNRKVPSVHQVCSEETLVPQTALTSSGSPRVSCSSPSPAQPCRQSRAPAHPKAAQKLHLSKPQTSQAEHSTKSSSSKSKPSACPTAETPRTSKTSIKTPTSTSQKPSCPPYVHKSNPDRGSIQLLSSPSLAHSQTEIPKSSHSPLSFQPDVSPLASTRPPILEEHLSPSPSISFSLRSTFTVSPSSSAEVTLLPKVHQSNPLQKGSGSSLLAEKPQSSQLSPEPTSSLKLSRSPPSNLEDPRQSQHSCCDPESLLSDNQLQLPLSPVSSSPLVPLFDAYFSHGSTPTNSLVLMSSTPIPDEHESTQDTQCIPSLPSHFSDVINNPPLAVEIEEEEELSIDSGDEMSIDSLDLAPHEEDSSDEEEAQMLGRLTRGRSREEEQGSPAISHTEDPFVPADADREGDLHTDEQEQLSEPSMVMHNQSAGSGSELFCDLDGFTPLGLDMNSGHSDTPEHTHWEPVHTCQTSPHDSDPTGSEGYGPSSSLSTYTEEHQLFRMMKDNHRQPTKIHSTRPTTRGEISANERGTSGSVSSLSGKSTPTLSHRPKTNPSPLSVAVCPSLSHSPAPPLYACLSRPTSGSEFGPASRPLSRAAQEIMEICGVDHTGCEDPDLDTDTTAHTLLGLEQELRLIAKETGKQASIFGTGNSDGPDQHGNHRFTRGQAGEEQKEEEAAARRDRQSVLLLP